jgi:hypothetical protein
MKPSKRTRLAKQRSWYRQALREQAEAEAAVDRAEAKKREHALEELVTFLREMVDDGFSTLLTMGVALRAGVSNERAAAVIALVAHELDGRRRTAALMHEQAKQFGRPE